MLFLYSIELVHADRIPTAVIRSRVRPQELAKFVPAACGEVWSFIQSARLARPGRHVALYLKDGESVEVGAEVSAPFIGSDRVHYSSLPEGSVATTAHFGPYIMLFAAHESIRAWCAKRGHKLTGISWEIYGHWEASWDDDPSKIRTDIFHLLLVESA